MKASDLKSSFVLSNNVLLFMRIIFAIYCTVCFIWSLSLSGADDLRYMTRLSWLGIGIYFWIITILSLIPRHSEQIDKYTKFTVKFFFMSTQTLSAVVTLVYWGLLSVPLFTQPQTALSVYFAANPHLTNIIMTQLELWLSKLTFKFIDIWIYVLIVISYASLSWVLHYVYSIQWPYFFFYYLDIEERPLVAVLAMLITLIGFTFIYLAIWLEVKWKLRVFTADVEHDDLEKKLPYTSEESINATKVDLLI